MTFLAALGTMRLRKIAGGSMDRRPTVANTEVPSRTRAVGRVGVALPRVRGCAVQPSMVEGKVHCFRRVPENSGRTVCRDLR